MEKLQKTLFGLTCVALGIALILLAWCANQLDKIDRTLDEMQFTITNAIDERSVHYRTIEYYLHNITD